MLIHRMYWRQRMMLHAGRSRSGDKVFRIFLESLRAPGRTKVVGLASVLDFACSFLRIDHHPADGVFHPWRGRENWQSGNGRFGSGR